jgi:hypothetical protein
MVADFKANLSSDTLFPKISSFDNALSTRLRFIDRSPSDTPALAIVLIFIPIALPFVDCA